MSPDILLWLVLIPAIAAVLCLGSSGRFARAGGPVLVAALAVNLGLAIAAFGQPLALEVPFGAFDMALRFRLDRFASFIVVSAAALSFLLGLYASRFMRGKPAEGPFFGFYLLTVGMLQGAVLADHLVTLLFFWEGMLGTLFAMIAVGGKNSFRTAIRPSSSTASPTSA